MNFASDNCAGASPAVMAALTAHAGGYAPAYGTDELTRRVGEWFSEIFEREVAVFFVATGTAANSLALSALTPPGGRVLCHENAHINVDEGSAAEFLAATKLTPLAGRHGKLDVATVRKAVERFPAGNVHHGHAAVLSLTQATEAGTVYTVDEVRELSAAAKAAGLAVHMDGARFANAVAALHASPADLTWRAGVDVLSFGGTKNGCWCAEAVVFFDRERAAHFAAVRKRAGHLFSKSRFVAAQFHGYFDHGHWLDNATPANLMARRLSEALGDLPGVSITWPTEANEVFALWPTAVSAALSAAGARFYAWPGGEAPEGHDLIRLVASFATSVREVDDLAAVAQAACRAAGAASG